MGKRRAAMKHDATARALPRLRPGEVTVIGIDPGLNGGLAWVHGEQAGACPMPLTEYDGREWVNAEVIAFWAREYVPKAEWTWVFCERSWVHRGNDSRTVFRLGAAYGAAVGAILQHYNGIVPVDPQEWQSLILPGVSGRSHLKRASVEFCRRRWPHVNLVPQGCRTPHDGMADALAIASFGQARLCGTLHTHHNPEPQPVRQRHGRA